MYGWVGDKREDLELVLYCNADLTGDRNDAKCMSGAFMCLLGLTSFVPLVGLARNKYLSVNLLQKLRLLRLITVLPNTRCLRTRVACVEFVGVCARKTHGCCSHGRQFCSWWRCDYG